MASNDGDRSRFADMHCRILQREGFLANEGGLSTLDGQLSTYGELSGYYWVAPVHGRNDRTAKKWAAGLSVRLLEITHGQWLYRNVLVHDRVSGSQALARKEDIAAQIKAQLTIGGDNLLAEDAYLMEVNLEDLSDSSGERHEYWLLAITAARRAAQL